MPRKLSEISLLQTVRNPTRPSERTVLLRAVQDKLDMELEDSGLIVTCRSPGRPDSFISIMNVKDGVFASDVVRTQVKAKGV